jgi:hypothetical protein
MSSFRKGKRITIPTQDVERIYQRHRKRLVRVTYNGPTKITCQYCGTPFLSLADGGVAILSTTQMPVSRKHTGRGRKHQLSLEIQPF